MEFDKGAKAVSVVLGFQHNAKVIRTDSFMFHCYEIQQWYKKDWDQKLRNNTKKKNE